MFKFEELPAKGLKGTLVGTGGHLVFRTGGKSYYVSAADFELKILSKDAIFRERLELPVRAYPAVVDYDPKSLETEYPGAEERPAKGKICRVINGHPFFLRVNWVREKHGCEPCCKRCRFAFIDYQLWHMELKIQIVSKDLSLYVLRSSKRKFHKRRLFHRRWDGFLQLNSENLYPPKR